ncbi:SGNH/GDSL hydrolase family protein [Ancylomarina sp. 16SWW S1-10-2]|uniref:SGNH/GDSL hydrolase family protein n=1 Tax=Ancylomarina sp. 16SWW S1-10-2 TaxID=2499681 RepID=UPI0012AE04DE|nr:SGNH/GDSL hydrolase family protein [Ancylomarina sp. 16SWW S1-10-2]MRT92814.1 electron transporter RnfD [Ancylomarina sp. 16SWW S1-10-2]
MRQISKLLLLLAVVLSSCTIEKETIVNSLNPNIEYWGRIDTTRHEGAKLYWSGTSIKINFEGESVQALLKDESGDNYYNIIIDSDSVALLRPDTTKQYYQLASKLSEGKHSIEIFKRTEWDRGRTNFYGFKLSNKTKLLPKTAPKRRKIEFYGNSITAGYAVEDTSGKDRPDSTFTNNYLSYAAITARHFDAEYQCICKSGIGITISWFPLIMPEIYDRLIPTDSTSKWNFSLYTPDIVVVNLFQNDSWLVNKPEREEFKTNFGNKAPSDAYLINAYQQFVVNLRMHYPNAKIICALGSMDATKEGSKWIDYINKAVTNLNDKNIYTHFIPYKGTPGHPTIQEQEELASSLIHFIDDNIIW